VASYHLSVKAISRKAGRSSTAAAAYRTATRIHDQRTGETHDYRRKRGVEYRELVLPASAPEWAMQREKLWNAVEAAERRKNSTLARDFEVALPSELTAAQRRELAVRFAHELVGRHGFAADVAIHKSHRDGDQRNHHAHILCSTRRMGREGFTEKTRELDGLRSGPEAVVFWRSRWADLQNEYLKQNGHEARVDHRSLKAQGIDREPTRHKGPAVTAMERRGQRTQVSERLTLEQRREIEARLERAAELGRLEREHAALTRSIVDLSGDLNAAKRDRDRQQTVQRTTSPVPHKDLSLEERFRERVERRAERLQGEWADEREREDRLREERREQNLGREKGLDQQRDIGLDLNPED
jgi:hypothetical protein